MGQLSVAMAIAALLCGLAGCAARAANPQAIDDALTVARIRTALVNDPQLGSRAIDIRVRAGVVHLNGSGFTDEEASRLQQIVRAVPGVTGLDSTVEITAAPRDPQPGPLADKRPPG